MKKESSEKKFNIAEQPSSTCPMIDSVINSIANIGDLYTSKTSPFVDIKEVLKKVEKNKLNQENKKLSSTVYGGIREGSIFYVNGKM